MKRLVLPVVLISFTVICLCFVHIDNINKLDKELNTIQSQKEFKLDSRNVQNQ